MREPQDARWAFSLRRSGARRPGVSTGLRRGGEARGGRLLHEPTLPECWEKAGCSSFKDENSYPRCFSFGTVGRSKLSECIVFSGSGFAICESRTIYFSWGKSKCLGHMFPLQDSWFQLLESFTTSHFYVCPFTKIFAVPFKIYILMFKGEIRIQYGIQTLSCAFVVGKVKVSLVRRLRAV